MRSRTLVILLTAGVLLAAGAASVYAGAFVLRAARSAPLEAAKPAAVAQPPTPAAPAPEQGLLVIGVLPGSPALPAGVHRGCIILAAGGQPVNAPEELDRIVQARRPGDALALDLANCGASGATVTLAAAPRPPDEGAPSGERAWLGVVVAPPISSQVPGSEGNPGAPAAGPSMSPVFFLDETGGARGVGVVGITPGSPAAQGGLQPGDVITAIAGADGFAPRTLLHALQARRPGDTLELTVQRAGQTLTLRVTLGALPGQPTRAYLGVYAWSVVGR